MTWFSFLIIVDSQCIGPVDERNLDCHRFYKKHSITRSAQVTVKSNIVHIFKTFNHFLVFILPVLAAYRELCRIKYFQCIKLDI